ncbi:MAG: amidohydrolase family protein, partial [Candidatus Hydrogenedentota bacterium]
MSGHWNLTDYDKALVKELGAMLPKKAFDIHAHLYRVADVKAPNLALLHEGPETVSVETWRARLGTLLPGSELAGGLFFPYVARECDNAAANAFVLEQVKTHPGSRGLVIATPSMTEKDGAAFFEHDGIVGFKPYHCYAAREDTANAAIEEYVPEWAWKLCHEQNGVIMLHMVKPGALSDPDNLAALERNCRAYPNARLVLAHAARGFHAPNTVNAIHALRGIENVWFDTSAVCEAGPLLAILAAFGPRKLMWGSDFPVSHQRGRCVTAGDGFFWLGPEHI